MERPIRLAALPIAVAGVHVIGAVYAWRLLPGGFPVGHARFWVNEALPVALVLAALACGIGVWKARPRMVALATGAFVGLHAGIAAGWFATFPETGGRLASIAAVAALVLALVAVASVRLFRWLGAGAAIGVMIGAGVARAQRGPDPSTHPAGPASAYVPPASGELPPGIEAGPEAVRFSAGDAEIIVRPVLSFISRSPDRGWTVFAAPHDQSDVQGALGVTMHGDDIVIDAETVVPEAVYSHLNAFCEISVRGHHRLFLAFSPMPDQRIEVTFSEYPTGKPSRFAFVDANSDVHVVESTSGEKGPFTELAHGHLAAGAPLGITLYDDAQPLATLELADFAAQASTELSPTGGWGTPQNAIELALGADRPDADAMLFLTLAGTSVGRGWDSVGHAPGLYRDRITVRRPR